MAAEEVTVGGVAAGGDGIARLADGRVVFVEGALPGERVIVSSVEEHRDFARGVAVEVVSASAAREAPPCPHLARGCGGCTWQYVRPQDQLGLKVEIVRDALRRIAKLPDADIRPGPVDGVPVPAERYRTSVRLAVDPDGRVAYRRRHGRQLVPVDSCLVAHPLLERLIVESCFPGASEVSLRVSAATGQATALVDGGGRRSRVPDFATVVGPGQRGVLTEVVGGRRWRVSARSFFQSGPAAAEALVDAVSRACGSVTGARILDLYGGIGLLGGALASAGGAGGLHVVESNASAVADAVDNLADLGARVQRAEVARLSAVPHVDLVVADPPRSGLGRTAAAVVAAAASPVVVLVSCDPASLARDVRLLDGHGFDLEGVEVLDLFPHTFHTETVSRFAARG